MIRGVMVTVPVQGICSSSEETIKFPQADEFYISTNGVLVLKRNNRFIKTFAEGRWLEADLLQ